MDFDICVVDFDI